MNFSIEHLLFATNIFYYETHAAFRLIFFSTSVSQYSNLLYEFYKTPFCRTRFLEHEERSDECYKENKCDKMAYKTKKVQNIMLGKLYLANRRVDSAGN
jgi:hypothetical protein